MVVSAIYLSTYFLIFSSAHKVQIAWFIYPSQLLDGFGAAFHPSYFSCVTHLSYLKMVAHDLLIQSGSTHGPSLVNPA